MVVSGAINLCVFFVISGKFKARTTICLRVSAKALPSDKFYLNDGNALLSYLYSIWGGWGPLRFRQRHIHYGVGSQDSAGGVARARRPQGAPSPHQRGNKKKTHGAVSVKPQIHRNPNNYSLILYSSHDLAMHSLFE